MKKQQQETSTASKYKIDKGIPLTKTKTQFPFSLMDIGDSFLVPDKDVSSTNNIRQKIYNEAMSYSRSTGSTINISIRKEAGGLRVFRKK